jgi:carbamoylphosphate synthase large subunit
MIQVFLSRSNAVLVQQALAKEAPEIVKEIQRQLDAYEEDGFKVIKVNDFEFSVFHTIVSTHTRQMNYVGCVPDRGQTAQEAFAEFRTGRKP